eukprot:387237-Amorphochlora_amoeboformis.AAC.1
MDKSKNPSQNPSRQQLITISLRTFFQNITLRRNALRAADSKSAQTYLHTKSHHTFFYPHTTLKGEQHPTTSTLNTPTAVIPNSTIAPLSGGVN